MRPARGETTLGPGAIHSSNSVYCVCECLFVCLGRPRLFEGRGIFIYGLGLLSGQGGESNLDSDSVLIGVLRLIVWGNVVVSLPARSAGKIWAFLHHLQGSGA